MSDGVDPRRIEQARLQVREARTAEERLRALETLVLVAPEDARAHFELARERARTGRNDFDALEHYRRALQLEPNLAEARLGMGIVHHRRGETDLAESLYLSAVAIKPRLAKAQLNLALIAEERRDFARAAELFGHAIELAPRSAEARHGRAKALWSLGRRDDALADWDRALEIDPGHAGALGGLAGAFAETGDPRAAEYYGRAVAANPRSSRLRVVAARWLTSVGRADEGERVLRDGLVIAPESSRLWNGLVDLLQQQGRPEEAVTALRDRLAHTADVGVRTRLVRLLGELARYDEAARELRPVLMGTPDDAEARRLMAAVQACAGRRQEAATAAQAALRLEPGCSWPRLLLMSLPPAPTQAADELARGDALVLPTARAYGLSMLGILQLALGNPAAAASQLERAVQAAPEAALPRVGRGVVYMAQGRLEQAQGELRTAAILEPHDYQVQHLAGEAAFHTRAYAEAARAFDAALVAGETEPSQRAYTFFCRARAFRKLGRANDAVQCYLEAERLDPDHVPTYYACGVALQELGRTGEALVQYQAAVAREPQHARAWMGVATCLDRLGRMLEAVDAYRAAIGADAGYAPPRYNLAVLLERTGAPEEVAALLRGYLRLAPDAANAADAKRRLSLAQLRAAGQVGAAPEAEEAPFLSTSEEGEMLTPLEV